MQLIQFPRTCAMSFLFQFKQHFERKMERWIETQREREKINFFADFKFSCYFWSQESNVPWGSFVLRWAPNLFMRSIVPTVLVVTPRLLERDPSASGPCGAALLLDSLMPSSIRLYDWGDRAAQSSFLLRVVISIRERFPCALQDVSYHVYSWQRLKFWQV